MLYDDSKKSPRITVTTYKDDDYFYDVGVDDMGARWLSAPPKEGRISSPSFAPGGKHRFTTRQRLLLGLAIVAVLFYTITSSSSSVGGASRFRSQTGLSSSLNIPTRGGEDGDGDGAGAAASTTSNGHGRYTSGGTKAAHDTVAETRKKVKSLVSSTERDSHLETALEKVLNIMPSEVAMRAFLDKIPGTGEVRLRELGLRTRAFKTYFEAWEDLHLTFIGDKVHVRDDVIQYVRQQPELVAKLDSDFAQVVHAYEAYRVFIQKFAEMLFPWTMPCFADHMTLHTSFYNGGRGIVLSGGDDQAPFLLTVISTIRELGCKLPIEIMYLGDSDLGEDWREKMEAMSGVVTRDIRAMTRDEGWKLAGWAGKPFSILLSSFREAMFIDADSLFLRDPEVLFDDEQYTSSGALFFKDRIIMPESKKKWLQSILPAPVSKNVKESRFWTGDSGHMQESGVVVVDKWKHFVALLMVTRMNGPDRDGNEGEGRVGIYDMVYGDKETFWLGWELVGDRSYAFHNGLAGILGRPWSQAQIASLAASDSNLEAFDINSVSDENATDDSLTSFTVCGPQLLHLDREERPIWFNGWILVDKHGKYDKLSIENFPVFVQEPTDGRKPDPWQLHPGNRCCLTADKAYSFLPEEKKALEMLISKVLLYNHNPKS